MNPQVRNASNLGDIIKHAALVSLIDVLAARTPGALVYVDTHTFLLETDCTNPDRWRAEVATEATAHAAAQTYRDAERAYVDRGRYRCSTGLVRDRLLRRRVSFILAESDPGTRRELETQLEKEGIRPHEFLEDARQLADVTLPDAVGTLFALVDPFVLDDSLWTSVACGLERLIEHATDAVVEVFTYHRGPVVWPASPAGVAGPVATIDRRPFHVALYASAGVARDVEKCGLALGWERGRLGRFGDQNS